jgi:hypothetical protein
VINFIMLQQFSGVRTAWQVRADAAAAATSTS